jgi:hypothetical protein
MNGKATELRKLTKWNGDARLFRLQPPITTEDGESEFVVVSASIAPYSGSETYIFAANDKGEVLNWGELDGSFRGGLDHERALESAGYAITEAK